MLGCFGLFFIVVGLFWDIFWLFWVLEGVVFDDFDWDPILGGGGQGGGGGGLRVSFFIE